ncbi:UNVERIFIED_CONTAM: hypothetical protein HDU68_010531 [Siphonaria sp. JEL0065]|nr:hypothetical protein HDU68_010531 [Siphonaria sp. JEL0065]
MNILAAQLSLQRKKLSPATMRVRRFDGSLLHFEAGKAVVEADGELSHAVEQHLGFQFADSVWSEIPSQEPIELECKNNNSANLAILTWNVWFATAFLHERSKALVQEAAESGAHVLCFQEATDTFISVLCKHPEIRKRFWVSNVRTKDSDRLAWPFYTCVVAVNVEYLRVLNWSRIDIPSTMGRHLWMLETQQLIQPCLNSTNSATAAATRPTILRLITSHFESLDKGLSYRTIQRAITKRMLLSNLKESAAYNLIACGDCNTTEDEEEDAFERLGFSDAWKHLKDEGKVEGDGSTIGVTYPSPQYRAQRFDRIVSFVGLGDAFVPVKYQELGSGAIEGLVSNKGGKVYPSDHLGVYVEYQLNKRE